jgi:hypothetical protein
VTDAACAIRRTQLLLDCACEGIERVVGAFLDEKRAVGERDETHGVGPDLGGIRCDDGVRRTRTEVARDAGLLPERSRHGLRPGRKPALAGEPFVERLAPPKEAHAEMP